jgi:phosphatidate cytidylyltransferase
VFFLRFAAITLLVYIGLTFTSLVANCWAQEALTSATTLETTELETEQAKADAGAEESLGKEPSDLEAPAATQAGSTTSPSTSSTAQAEPESNFKPIPIPSSNDLFPTYMLLGVLLIALAIASIVGQYLRRQPSESMNPALIRRFRQRVNAWWLMSAILAFSLAVHATGAVVLFLLTSFWALREFITMAPTRRGDHRALFWALIVFTPLQYILIGIERLFPNLDMYDLYSIMIPVYASIFVPARIALSGDAKRFLERSAQITSGLLICVYALSHAPAMLNLKLMTSAGVKWTGSTAGLLCFFVLLTQLSEILQWTWGHVVGKRVIAEEISTSRTWEGFLGGTLSLGVVGAVLWWVTPFTIWEAACMSMVIGVMGMFGGMTMSAIKRDRGVNDYGSLVLGHAGVLDRIDTLCFSAPVFYHLTRYFYT